jgi:hypothetical protein
MAKKRNVTELPKNQLLYSLNVMFTMYKPTTYNQHQAVFNKTQSTNSSKLHVRLQI